LIGERERAAIAAAQARARAHPIPLSEIREGAVDRPVNTLKLSDRKPNWRRRHQSEQVLIPRGYRAAISVEEQPAGMCWHLSISVERTDPTKMPSVEAVRMIAEAFGIDFDISIEHGGVWTEEYEPGRHAVNIVSVFAPGHKGTA